MDPISWLTTLQTILSAVQVWQNERSIQAASTVYKQDKDTRRTYEWFIPELTALKQLIPDSTLKILIERTDKCRAQYEEVLLAEDAYLPSEIDSATQAVKKCICRELARIKELNAGELPTPYLQRLWDGYNCTDLGC